MPEISRFYGMVIGARMYWTVTSAKLVGGYRLEVTFQDGKTGVVDFAKYVRQGGVFKRLASRKVFKQWRINPDFGTICWGNDLDIAPETLYDEATASQRKLAHRSHR